MLQVLQHVCNRDRMGEPGLFSLEQKRLWGHPIMTFQNFRATRRRHGEKCFSRACPNWRRGNGFKP